MNKVEIHCVNADFILQSALYNLRNNINGAILVDNEPIDMGKWRKAVTLTDLAYAALFDGLVATAQYLVRELRELPYTATVVADIEHEIVRIQEAA